MRSSFGEKILSPRFRGCADGCTAFSPCSCLHFALRVAVQGFMSKRLRNSADSRPGAALGFRYRSRMDAARSSETNAPGCTLFARAMFGESSPKFSDFDLTTPSEDLSLSMKQKPQKEFGEGEQIAVVKSKSVPIG